GVMVEHRSVSNYSEWLKNHAAYSAATRVDCSSSFSFDTTVGVLFAPLFSGQRIILCSEFIKQDMQLYLEHLEKQMVTLIKLTPTYFSNLLNNYDTLFLLKKLSQIKCVVIAGEKVSKELVLKCLTLLPNCTIINFYGPTETT
ncbi:AMP-binding protein, partial [Legionella oakridgensis]|uniref:AMP-binding protein n=1 Tax=Legionella oakridgensis TaxID=29423 RepID=UPI00055A85B1